MKAGGLAAFSMNCNGWEHLHLFPPPASLFCGRCVSTCSRTQAEYCLLPLGGRINSDELNCCHGASTGYVSWAKVLSERGHSCLYMSGISLKSSGILLLSTSSRCPSWSSELILLAVQVQNLVAFSPISFMSQVNIFQFISVLFHEKQLNLLMVAVFLGGYQGSIFLQISSFPGPMFGGSYLETFFQPETFTSSWLSLLVFTDGASLISFPCFLSGCFPGEKLSEGIVFGNAHRRHEGVHLTASVRHPASTSFAPNGSRVSMAPPPLCWLQLRKKITA